MQINLTTSYTALSSLIDVAATTKFKVQVISGRVLATESAEEPDQYSSEGYQFGSLEMFTSTASFGTLYVRATSPDTRIEVTVADTGFSEGVSPFTGATGSTSGGGGGTSETPASIKQKYESNPNTNALTDELKEKIESAGEGVTIDQVQQKTDAAEQASKTYTDQQIGGLPATITPDAAQAKADKAQADAILYSDGKRATGIDGNIDGQKLTLKITNSLGDIDSTEVTLPSGGAALNLPDGTIPADVNGVVPMVEAGQLVDSGLRATDGTLETAPNSVLIGFQRYSSGGISSFIYDHIANKYYRVLRQDAETYKLMTASMSGGFKEHQTTQLFGTEIEFPNIGINKITLPTQDEDFLYIPAAGEVNSFFEIALARPVTSNLIIELDILGDVVMKVDAGIHDSGLINVVSPPLDLDVLAEVNISAYQKNGEPVFLGGQDGNVYLRFKYQAFDLVDLQSGGGSVSSVDVSYSADTKALTVGVDNVTGFEVLDFVDAVTLAQTQEASLELANAYTRQQIAEIPSGGGGDVTIGLPDGSVPVVDGKQLKESGIKSLEDGSVLMSPASLWLGSHQHMTGGLSDFVYDKIENKYHRLMRQDLDTYEVVFAETEKDVKLYESGGHDQAIIATDGIPITLPQADRYIYVQASGEIEHQLSFWLAQDTSSRLTIELRHRDAVLARYQTDNAQSEIAGEVFPLTEPLDLDALTTELKVYAYQENGSPVKLGGENGGAYIKMSYHPITFKNLVTDGIRTSEVNNLITASGDESKVYTDNATSEAIIECKEYTDEAIKNLPSGGGGSADGAKVGEIIMLADRSIADDTMLYCDHSVVKKSDYPELYAAIGDTYQEVNTSEDSFRIPNIPDVVEQGTQQILNLDDLITEYSGVLQPAKQQIAGTILAGTVDDTFTLDAYFVFNHWVSDLAPVNTVVVKIAHDGTHKSIDVDYTDDAVIHTIFATDRNLSVVSLDHMQLYHTMIYDDEIKDGAQRVTISSGCIHPVLCAFVNTNRTLVVLDKIHDDSYVLRAKHVVVKTNGEITLGDDNKSFDLPLPNLTNPKNLLVVENAGQDKTLAGLVIANNGNSNCYLLDLASFELTEANVIDGMQFTGIDQAVAFDTNGLSRYFATDNKALYQVHVLEGAGNSSSIELIFYRNIRNNAVSENLTQPLIATGLFAGDDEFLKALVTHDTGKILFSGSDLADISVPTQKTSHYIKAKTNSSNSGVVEKVEADVQDNVLTIGVNDITATTPLPTTDLSGVDARIDNLEVKVPLLESKVSTLEAQLTTALETIEDIKKAAYSGFALYSNNMNELDVHMHHIDTGVDDDVQSILLDGLSPSPDQPGGGGLYTVYHGWSKSNIGELTETEITNVLPEDRTMTIDIYGDDHTPPPVSDQQYILDAVFDHTRTLSDPISEDDAAYIYIVFPALIVSPEIDRIINGSLTVQWRTEDISIGGEAYKIFMTDDVNIAPSYSIKLSNGN